MANTPQELTIHSASKGWHRVDTPNGDKFVSTVYIAGVRLESDYGDITLRVESEAWTVEGEHDPCLLVEAPSWYEPEKEDLTITRPELNNFEDVVDYAKQFVDAGVKGDPMGDFVGDLLEIDSIDEDDIDAIVSVVVNHSRRKNPYLPDGYDPEV